MSRHLRRHCRVIAPASALIALWIAGSSAACRPPTTEAVVSDAPVAVSTDVAVRGDIRSVIDATGSVTPGPGAELVVVAPEPARIIEMPAAVGDRVRRGDVLVRFEVPGATADVQRQAAEIARAEATIAAATSALARARELFDRGVAARREVEEATRALADAEATLDQARAARTAALAVSDRTVVRATFDGVVARRTHNPGDVVEATAGDAVLRVIDPRRLEVLASVPLADAARITVGARAHLTGDATPPALREVTLSVLARPPAVETGASAVGVRLGFARPVDLPTGLPVQVEIDAEQHRDVVTVPVAAVVREAGDTAVFVVSAGTAARRGVEVGLSDGTRVEIIKGVTAGDVVIVEGQSGLPDGAPVTPHARNGAPTPTHGPADTVGADGGK